MRTCRFCGEPLKPHQEKYCSTECLEDYEYTSEPVVRDGSLMTREEAALLEESDARAAFNDRLDMMRDM